VRCAHEAQLHDHNTFVTLTYSEKNLPATKSLDKEAIPKFIRRLRKKYQKEVRYYGCGEYGDKLGRPHYHVCLFGIAFGDKKLWRQGRNRSYQGKYSPSKDTLYRSEALENLWPYGFSTIGDLTFQSAAYVARYCTKKITGPSAQAHYQGKTPEFALMSRRPGIGYGWINQYMTDVYPKDYFTLNGHKQRPPRYYDVQYSRENNDKYLQIKERRKEKQKDESVKRMYQQEIHLQRVTKTLRRNIEDENYYNVLDL